jgi:hypothetical protein
MIVSYNLAHLHEDYFRPCSSKKVLAEKPMTHLKTLGQQAVL